MYVCIYAYIYVHIHAICVFQKKNSTVILKFTTYVIKFTQGFYTRYLTKRRWAVLLF